MAQALFTTVIWQGGGIDARLRQLGLDLNGLHDVVEKGEAARMQATRFDPRTAAGTDAYRYRVRAMREQYCTPGNWTVLRDNGLELIRSPSGDMAVMTRAGNSHVGLAQGHPRPTNDIGGTTRAAVARNETLFLDPNWMNVSEAPTQPGKFQTWMLLVHRDEDIVRSELSLPAGTVDAEEPPSWLERILLPHIDFGDGGGAGKRSAKPEADVFVAPTIRRR